jgi:hypothetical protein
VRLRQVPQRQLVITLLKIFFFLEKCVKGKTLVVCLDQSVWKKLLEELLMYIFATLPTNDIILGIGCLNKS